jgi:hypothetical protein
MLYIRKLFRMVFTPCGLDPKTIYTVPDQRKTFGRAFGAGTSTDPTGKMLVF